MNICKNVFISYSLPKLLLPAATAMNIVSIILNAIYRFGMTSCNLLVLVNQAASIGSLKSSGNNSLAIYSSDQRSHSLISLFFFVP